MSSHSSPIPLDSASPVWREIEDLLDELAQAAQSTLREPDFYRMLLDRLVPAVGACGGALWTAERPDDLRLECKVYLESAQAGGAADAQSGRASLIREVLSSRQSRVVPPGSESASGQATGNATDCTLFLFPFPAGLRKAGVIELMRQGKVPPAEVHGYLRVLAAVVEVIADFDHNRELADLRSHDQSWRQLELFALRVHASLDLNHTAYVIANEGRRLLDCDRVSVVVQRGAKFQAAAISGVDVLEPRAQLVRRLERLAERAAATCEPLWYSDGMADLPEEVDRPLQEYLDESHSRVLAILPLVEPSDDRGHGKPAVLGVLVIEQFQSSLSDASLRSRAATMAGHGAVALANARTHSQMPLASAGRWLARMHWLAEARQLPRTMIASIVAALVVAALALIPADFNIEVRGELEPVHRRDVFASDDGVVNELLVDHGRTIRKGDPLVVLRKPQLDLELSRVVGEMQTAEKKLAAVQAERLKNAPSAPDARRNLHQLTADEEELKKLLEGLREQHAILEAQRGELTVRSPLDGQTLTWNLRELLEARPVQRGQTLLTVADLDGPWELELYLPDYRAGHILAARAQQGAELDVSFALTSEPGTVYRGKITDMALSTRFDEKSEPTVLVTVGLDRKEVEGLRPGATVIAQIHCGRRSIGYVWLHDLFEAIQSHWWW